MQDQAVELLRKTLQDKHYSVTKPRLVVFELLWGREPQSMRELTTHAHGKIDRASLYRTIGLFEELGIVQRLYIGWKYKVELSDIFTHHHHHISCLKCGTVVVIKEDQQIEQLIRSLAERCGITAEQHQLEVQGYCKTCQAATH